MEWRQEEAESLYLDLWPEVMRKKGPQMVEAEITHNKEQWCMSRAAEDGYLLTCWVKTLVKVYSATESIVELQLGQTVIFGFIVMPTEDIELHSLPKKPIRAINLKCQKVAACEG